MTRKITNPWLSIWSKPAETVKEINFSGPRQWIGTLSLVIGLFFIFPLVKGEISFFYDSQEFVKELLAVFGGIVLSGFFGFLVLSLLTCFFTYIARTFFHSRARSIHIRTAIAWSFVPVIPVSIVYLIILMAPHLHFPLYLVTPFVLYGVVLAFFSLREAAQFPKSEGFAAVVTIVFGFLGFYLFWFSFEHVMHTILGNL